LNLILTNGNVITLDPAYPRANTVVIIGNKVVKVEDKGNFKSHKKQGANVIDCSGKTILPGFIDAHCHLVAFGESLVTLNLDPGNDTYSISDIQSKINKLSQKSSPGTWIKGRGYNEFYLIEKRHPTRWDLDVATSIHPVKLTHRSNRAHVLNSLALAMVGISEETADPPEGLIDRDLDTGEPTGLLYNMSDYLAKFIPPTDNQQIERGIELANQELLALGITSVQDASSYNSMEQWVMFQQWKRKGILRPRLSMMLGIEGFKKLSRDDFSTQTDQSQLRLGGVKIIIHETTGQLHPSQEELNEMVLRIHEAGMQVILHAVEKETIEAGCNAIEFALKRSPRQDHRHRIEHCSVCTPSLAKRIASLGMIVVTQPSFIYYNGERYLRTVADSELMHLYPIATLIKSGVRVVGSSDFPVVPPNPLKGIYSSISRLAKNGEAISPVEERITLTEALRMYTDEAARTTFEEMIKGSVTPNKVADLVVLNGDLSSLPLDEIKDIEVEMTILNGEIVWEKKA